jgi:uncharacterized repeat protein (TIGR01451 family)
MKLAWATWMRFGVIVATMGSGALAAADARISSYGYNGNMTVNVPSGFSVTINNAGTDEATGVKLQSALPQGFEFVPTSTCSADAVNLVTCNIGSLGAGREARLEVRFVPRNAAKVNLGFNISSDIDANPDNNAGAYDANVFPQSVLEVKAGTANPVARGATKGQRGVPVLQVTLRNTTEFPAIFDDATNKPSARVDAIFLKAFGTGHDAKDITAVHVYDDRNGNGAVDTLEPLLETTFFAGDDGSLEIGGVNLSPDTLETRQQTLLVTLDFNDELHLGAWRVVGAGVGLSALALMWCSRRKRLAWLALGGVMVLTLGACPSPQSVIVEPPEPSALTYGVKLTTLVQNQNDPTSVQTALPLTGATITIPR